MAIYIIFKSISYLSFFPVLLFFYYLFGVIREGSSGGKSSFSSFIDTIGPEISNFAGKYTKIILSFSLIALLITNTAVHQLIGVNNLRIKPEGTYCFYVEATNEAGKTYTIPSQVKVEIVEIDENKSKIYYHVEKIYFSNGGYVSFIDANPDRINKVSIAYDKDFNQWQLVLLNEHAFSPNVTETNNATWLDIILLLIPFISTSIMLFALIKYEITKKSQQKEESNSKED